MSEVLWHLFPVLRAREPAIDTVLRSRNVELTTNDTTAHSSITSASDHSEECVDFDMVPDDLTFAKAGICIENRESCFAQTEANLLLSNPSVPLGGGLMLPETYGKVLGLKLHKQIRGALLAHLVEPSATTFQLAQLA